MFTLNANLSACYLFLRTYQIKVLFDNKLKNDRKIFILCEKYNKLSDLVICSLSHNYFYESIFFIIIYFLWEIFLSQFEENFFHRKRQKVLEHLASSLDTFSSFSQKSIVFAIFFHLVIELRLRVLFYF